MDVLVVSKCYTPDPPDPRGTTPQAVETALSYDELVRLIAALQAQAMAVPLPDWPAGVNYASVVGRPEAAA